MYDLRYAPPLPSLSPNWLNTAIVLGTPDGNVPWALGEEEAIEHIKFAYDAGINTFDTANFYSSGLSEVILGKAIKQLGLPRDEIVIMTKVYFAVGHDYNTQFEDTTEANGYVNQSGLSRKVSSPAFVSLGLVLILVSCAAHL